jgi:plastocyanin
MKKWIALPALCLALVAAGCGSDDDEDAGDNAETTEQPAATTEQPAETMEQSAKSQRVMSVRMKDTLFVPMDVTVAVGGTVKWKNDDPFAHTVTKQSGPGRPFDSGTVKGGGTFEQKFDKAGQIDYVCTIHPSQTGTITVE